MAREEPVTFVVEGLRLEGRLAAAEKATRAAVLCHPHPQYGGSMDNNVIDALVASLGRRDVATLRFNVRGVGRSEGRYANGIGETADARAAVAFLRERTGADRVALAGYSFGAMIALQAGYDDPDVARLIGVAPPLSFFDLAFAASCRKPKLLLAGDRDSYCSIDALRSAAELLPQPIAWTIVDGADHFFVRHEEEVAETVAEFVCAPEPER
jgi:alpha/beta superfamily hydrolase